MKRDTVVSTAQQFYREQSGKDVGFSFGFNKDHPIDNEMTLARSIAGLANVLSHEPPGAVLRERYRHIPELSFWYQSKPPNKGAPWQVSQGHKTEIMSIEGLEAIVASKEARSKGYQPCDAFWLLVVVDFFDRAQDQQLLDRVTMTSMVFEKIIVYQTVYRKIVEAQKR